ncbi:SocA family protein [Patescibacteria group bacterium]|nr:SocA family protein [Patescibacteria group bacterium]
MKIQDLLYIIAKEFKQREDYYLGRTKLIKLAYLSEIFYKRLFNKRLTHSNWVFWKYGPYLMDYPTILNSAAFFKSEEDDFKPIKINYDYRCSAPNLDEKCAINRTMEFAETDLNELLDFIYFDTEPMVNTTSRGESLDFNCVKPEEAYKIKEYHITKEMGNRIDEKIKEWKKKRIESQ